MNDSRTHFPSRADAIAEQIVDGFAIIPDLLADSDVVNLVEALERCELPRTRAGIRHAMKIPAVSAFASDARLLELAHAVLGSSSFPFRATLFNKSPAANWLVVWHQDTALPQQQRREVAGWGPWSVKDGLHYAHAPSAALKRVVALRVHLDGSSADNGPLRVLPGTHKRGVLNDDEIHVLSTQLTATDCLAPRGGVVAMRPLIVHASSKSQSPAPRRVLHIEYAAASQIAPGLALAIA